MFNLQLPNTFGVFLVLEILAAPFGYEGASAIMNRQWKRAGGAYAIALPLAVAGLLALGVPILGKDLTATLGSFLTRWLQPLSNPYFIVVLALVVLAWLGGDRFVYRIRAALNTASVPTRNRVTLQFENREPFVVRTPTERVGMVGRVRTPGPDRVYVRVFPECEARVENCEAHLLAIYREQNGNWMPTPLNEACSLMWANRGGFAGPLEVQPRVGPFVDVLYVEDGNDQIVPCVAALPLRAEGAFHRLGTYRLDVQVTNSDPIALRVRPGTTGPTPSVQVERIDPYPGNDELVATTQIEQLRGQIAELTEDTRRVTRDQRRRFGQAVPKVLPELFESPPRFEYKGVRVTYGSTIEAQNYAEELSRLFGENGLTTSRAEEFTHESLNTTGLKVHVADPSNPIANDRKTMALLDAAGIDYEIEERTTEFPEITVLRVGRTVSR